MNEQNSPAKVWNRGFILIFIANLFQHMGQQTITTLVPKYAAALGATSTIVGIVSGAFAISAIAIRPVASPAFDCFRKRHIYSIANIVLLLAYVLFYTAPNYNWLIAGRLLQGIGVGMSAPIALSIACDNLPEGGFAKAQYQMGLLCEDGRGVEEDPDKAKSWFELAAEQDYAAAKEKLAG